MDNEKMFSTLADYQSTFNSPSGRKVLRHLMRVHGFLSTSHVDKDPYATAFNEGARNVVVQIMNKLKIDLKQLHNELITNNTEDKDVII